MDLESKLYLIEEGFWLQSQDHFLEHLDECCLLAFPQAGEMHGLFDRENVAATATPSNRWRDLRMYDRHLLEVGDVAIISYRAEVTRADGQPYAALVLNLNLSATSIAIAIALGVALGLVFDNTVAGIGIALALMIALSLFKKRTTKQEERSGRK